MTDVLQSIVSLPWYAVVAWGCCACPGIGFAIALVIGAATSIFRDDATTKPDDDTDIQPPRGPYAPH